MVAAASSASQSSYPRTPRDRSRVVCQRCHARKVKCDLLARMYTFSSCTNCEKRDDLCLRRERVPCRRTPDPTTSAVPLERRPDAAATPPLMMHSLEPPSDLEQNEREHRLAQPPSLAASAMALDRCSDAAATPPFMIGSLETPPGLENNEHGPLLAQSPSLTTSVDRGYIGERSLMSNHGPLTSEAAATLGSISTSLERQAFTATRADQLPSQSILDASIVAYFKYLYHRIPVVDRQDITAPCPSTLLSQSLCFVGSFLRHPKSLEGLQQLEEYYTKAKILFLMNHEKEPLITLKALCFFTLWNVRPPSVVTIDCSWNWLGLAMRLAIQMGLHQFDLRPLSLADFGESEHDQARSFIFWTELAKIYARMLKPQHAEVSIATEEALSVLADLRIRALSIPADFRICDDQGQKVYHREFYECIACYLTCIITYFHNFGQCFQPSVASRISLVTSSCIIGVYQEMDYHDDINYLTAINNWSMMAASLPQLANIPRELQAIDAGEKHSNRGPSSLEELDTLLGILRQRSFKFPGSKAIVNRIEHLKLEVLSQHHDPSSTSFGAAPRQLSEPTVATYSTVLKVHELFPFPKSLCPRLELLDAIEAEAIVDGFFDNYTDWPMENMLGFDDINVLDFV
ncbi:hypothetical protein DL98DRAFT_577020 [Cadophora sp. DSE1049]|nr:hypothetical protein DL98DRAFT_577020 [Cadophora sp. DSE1049]